MLHNLDTGGQHQRAAELALLARASVESLERGLAGFELPEHVWLRKPQTGLAMVTGRIGGDGNPFNLGEITMTRCVLRIQPHDAAPCIGVGYVMGRSHRLAELVALYDALLQTGFRRSTGQAVLDAIDAQLGEQRAQAASAASGTKVEFFTMVREAGQ